MAKTPTQKFLILLSCFTFFGSLACGAFAAINTLLQQPTNANIESMSKESKLKLQEKGYEIVLKREPENQVALEGLLATRLEMNNSKGAIDTLNKLIKLNPNQQEYKVQLNKLNQQIAKDNHNSRKLDKN